MRNIAIKTTKRKRAYHNQSFKYHFLDNLKEYNNAIFDNKQKISLIMRMFLIY